MTDSPAFRYPTDVKEQPILDRIVLIRDHLSLLKQDRSRYIKASDIVTYYNQLIEQVDLLNKIRETKPEEQNRVDIVLDDCFQLISLFFLTIGRNSEAPAIYSAVSTVKRLLDHLKEAGFYSPKDLDGINHHLNVWQTSVERGRETHSDSLLTLLEARINVCRTISAELQQSLLKIEPALMGTYEKLVSILRSLSACNTRSNFPEGEVQELEEQLLVLQKEFHQERDAHTGKSAEELFAQGLSEISLSGSTIEKGEDLIRALLARCLLWIEIMQQKRGRIDERFSDTYAKLVKIRNSLEGMNLTQAWSLRETDLYSFQRELDRIDAARRDGNFLDAEGRPAEIHAQRTLLYLLRRSYAYIYQYIITSEPVSEALLPIYNQLQTLKRCLLEVQRAGGVDSPRELYPYSMKLNSIDNMKKDGKFMVGNEIPEGQASIAALLSECFDICYELRNEAEERNEAAEQKHVPLQDAETSQDVSASA